jgi:hypothetical protein
MFDSSRINLIRDSAVHFDAHPGSPTSPDITNARPIFRQLSLLARALASVRGIGSTAPILLLSNDSSLLQLEVVRILRQASVSISITG